MGDPAGVHRLLTGQRLSVFAPFLSSGVVFLRQLLSALLPRRIISGNFLFESGKQLLQRAFDLASQTKIGLVAVIRHLDTQWIFVEHGTFAPGAGVIDAGWHGAMTA